LTAAAIGEEEDALHAFGLPRLRRQHVLLGLQGVVDRLGRSALVAGQASMHFLLLSAWDPEARTLVEDRAALSEAAGSAVRAGRQVSPADPAAEGLGGIAARAERGGVAAAAVAVVDQRDVGLGSGDVAGEIADPTARGVLEDLGTEAVGVVG